MRIAVFDNWLGSFSGVLMEYWRSQGHEVIHEPGFNPVLVETCDRVFFESADTNAHLATQQRPHKKGKVYLRIVDIDAHANGPAGVQSGYFDGIIYIADHIQKLCESRFKNLEGTPSKLIPMGVNTDKFTYREKPAGNKIAFTSTRLTPEKGFDRALMILADLLKLSNQWELHVVGRMHENSVWKMHIEHIIESNNMQDKVHFYGNLPYKTGTEINDFLEDKDYLLMTSHKEAFSFSVAEAMSKGIKPVIYNFKGAEQIWGKQWLFNTPQEAISMFTNNIYTPQVYRDYVVNNYPLEKHVKAISEFMEI